VPYVANAGVKLYYEIEWQSPWRLLRQMRCPALPLVGEREDPAGNTARAAALMPNARCVTLPELDHITAYERSDLALAHAVPFLRSLRWTEDRP
jgi:pimeloyl-ACP methyl ester carboxylesterase